MRLNDAQYFRLPLPHTRKRMMVIRVIPRIMDANYFHVVQDSTASSDARLGMKSRYRGKMLESKQSSAEIALVTYNGFESVDELRNKEEHQDICVETETTELLNDPSSLVLREDVPPIVRDKDSEKFAEFPHAEDDRRETVRKIVRDPQELRGQVEERSCKSVDRKRSCGDRYVVEIETEEKCDSWWKDGGQTILQFFAKILGKRGRIGVRGATGYVLPTGKRVKGVSRGDKGHNGCRRDKVDKGIRLKRVDNGYIANHVYRDEKSRHDVVTKNKSREKQQHHPSVLVRQIQRTRDKNLRVMLLERELRARLPKTDRRDACLTFNGSVNVRQLSSPLC